MTKKDKVTVDDIIGIVHTDETTNSVDEVRKLRGRNERFIVDTAGTLIDMVTRENFDIVEEVVDILNNYEDTCVRYEKIISELKNGTYKEELPITQRK